MHATMQSTYYISSNLVGEMDEHKLKTWTDFCGGVRIREERKVLHAMRIKPSCVRFNEMSAIEVSL